jgi:epoxyqueuosine reductase
LDSSDNLNSIIKSKASELGFERCGITRAVYLEKENSRFTEWIGRRNHAGMEYLEKNSEKRADPAKLVDYARTVIVVLMRYDGSFEASQGSPKFSRYAVGRDYHTIV